MKSSGHVVLAVSVGLAVGVSVPVLRHALTDSSDAPPAVAGTLEASPSALQDAGPTIRVQTASDRYSATMEAFGLPPLEDTGPDTAKRGSVAAPKAVPPATRTQAKGASPLSAEQQLAKKLISQHSSWIFRHDRAGKIQHDARGAPVLTEDGRRYAAFILQAERDGITGVRDQHNYALAKLSSVVGGARSAAPAKPAGGAASWRVIDRTTIDGWNFDMVETGTLVKTESGSLFRVIDAVVEYNHALNPKVVVLERLGQYLLVIEGLSKPLLCAECKVVRQGRIENTFNGFQHGALFKFDNGDIWEQTDHTLRVSVKVYPRALIFLDDGVYRLHVDGVGGSPVVRRVK